MKMNWHMDDIYNRNESGVKSGGIRNGTNPEKLTKIVIQMKMIAMKINELGTWMIRKGKRDRQQNGNL